MESHQRWCSSGYIRTAPGKNGALPCVNCEGVRRLRCPHIIVELFHFLCCRIPATLHPTTGSTDNREPMSTNSMQHEAAESGGVNGVDKFLFFLKNRRFTNQFILRAFGCSV